MSNERNQRIVLWDQNEYFTKNGFHSSIFHFNSVYPNLNVTLHDLGIIFKLPVS